MARKYASKEFTPKNPQKYIGGNKRIIYRSSWEYSAMKMFDEHPNCLAWASESINIPYQNPYTGRWTVYVPDFLVVYVDRHGAKHCEMMEVKPLKETPGFQGISPRTGRPMKLTERDRMTQGLNAAKWTAALAYCKKRGWQFRVVTEETLFNYERKS